MYVLGIGGSPRHGGFSDKVLDSALAGARLGGCHVEKLVLNDLSIRPCQDCGGCSDTGICVIGDDMKKVRAEIASADGIIVSTPVYFGSVTAQLKCAIDRYQDAWVAKHILKNHPFRRKTKKGIFMCVSGQVKQEYFENSRQIVKNFFATLDIEYSMDAFFGGAASIAIVSMDEALKKAFDLGVELVRRLQEDA